MNNKIDIIISWLNPDDEHWQKEFAKAKLKYTGDSSNNRINDYSTFKYFLRSVDENLAFINKIFIVLNDEYQLPNWLDTTNKKLKIVYLKDYVPQFLLPQFNTFAIEAFYHLIPELSEMFIFCNDDMIFTKKLTADFFFKNGLPVDINTRSSYISCNPIDAITSNRLRRNSNSLFGKMCFNTLKYAQRTIDKKISFYENTHMPCPFLKSSWKKWLNTKELCKFFYNSKFRNADQISTILMMRWVRLHFKEYIENSNILKDYQYIEIHGNDIEEYNIIMNSILNGKILCINDNILPGYFTDVKNKISLILQNTFPQKCQFEK